MGTTDTGKTWCIKALHPSDPITEVRGIPDKSAVPTVFLNYQSTYTLAPPGDAKPSWQFDVALVPHPISFLSGMRSYSDGSSPASFSYRNQQIQGASHSAQYTVFRAMCERWRLAYMSVTVYQDAPSLADQGTICVCQLPVQPYVVWPNGGPTAYAAGGDRYQFCTPACIQYQIGDYPSFERSQAMPNAYFARSKEGAYVPLKLTKTCQKWHSAADSQVLAAGVDASVFDPTTASLIGSMCGVAIPSVDTLATWQAYPGGTYPHLGLKEAAFVRSVNPASLANAGYTTLGEATSPACNDNWGHISARNLSPATSYSFFVRCGFEVQVQPGSVLSPQLKLSPPYDEAALTSYFAISRELKDAYPADYNDLGKIWNVIKGVASAVHPLIRNVPVIGPVSDALQLASKATGMLTKRASGGGRRSELMPSQAERERMQSALRGEGGRTGAPITRRTKTQRKAAAKSRGRK